MLAIFFHIQNLTALSSDPRLTLIPVVASFAMSLIHIVLFEFRPTADRDTVRDVWTCNPGEHVIYTRRLTTSTGLQADASTEGPVCTPRDQEAIHIGGIRRQGQ